MIRIMDKVVDIVEIQDVVLKRLSQEEIKVFQQSTDEYWLSKAKGKLKKASRVNADLIPYLRNADFLNSIAAYLSEADATLNFRKRNGKFRNVPSIFKNNDLDDVLTNSSPREALNKISEITQAIKKRREHPFTFIQELWIKKAVFFKRFNKRSYHKDVFEKGQNRAYYSVEDKRISYANRLVHRVLKSQGYDVVDYKAGLAIKRKDHPDYKKGDEANKLKISKLLRRIERETAAEQNSKKIHNYDIARARILFENDETRHSLILVLSRDTYDIAKMSTDRGWRSCMAADGAFFLGSISAIEQGSVVSYLVKKTDLDIRNPISRVTLHPYQPSVRSHFARQMMGRALDRFRNKDFFNLKSYGEFLVGYVSWLPSKVIYETTNLIGLSDTKKSLKGTKKAVMFSNHVAFGLNQDPLKIAVDALCCEIAQSHPLFKDEKRKEMIGTFNLNGRVYQDALGRNKILRRHIGL